MMRISSKELFTTIYDYIQAILSYDHSSIRVKLFKPVFESCLAIIGRALQAEDRQLVQDLASRMVSNFPSIEANNMLQGIGVKNLLQFMEQLSQLFENDLYMKKMMFGLRDLFDSNQATELIILFFKEDIGNLTQQLLNSKMYLSEVQFYLLKSKLFIELPALGFNHELTIHILATLELLKESFCEHENDKTFGQFAAQAIPLVSKEVVLEVDRVADYYEKVKFIKKKVRTFRLEAMVAQLLRVLLAEKGLRAVQAVLEQHMGRLWHCERDMLLFILDRAEGLLREKVPASGPPFVLVSSAFKKARWSLQFTGNPFQPVAPLLEKLEESMVEFFQKDKACINFLNKNPEENLNLTLQKDNEEAGLRFFELILECYFNPKIWFRPETFRVGCVHKQLKPEIFGFWVQAVEASQAVPAFQELAPALHQLHLELGLLFRELRFMP